MLVISHLSVGEHAVDEETFQSTMKYIFSFIEKARIASICYLFNELTLGKLQEKQAESIVDKLCQRFRLSDDPRQWRDIAFCLSLLPFKSERSLKKLIEGLPFYQDKLHEPVVFTRFSEMLSKVCHSVSIFRYELNFARQGQINRPASLTLTSKSSRMYV